MGKGFNFWSMCLRRARQRSSPFANDWQWAFGLPFWQWASGTSTFAGFVRYLASNGHGSMSTGYPALDGIFVAVAAFAVTWIVGFGLNIFGSASHFYYVEKEKADTLQQKLDDLKKCIEYRLAVSAEVEDHFLTGGKTLAGKVYIRNMSNDPMQYGPVVFSATFQNDAPKILNGNEAILPPLTNVYYPFEFDERAMATNRGSVIFTADIDYGPVGSRTRRIHKKIEVEYTVVDGKFIAEQNARDREHTEIAIPGL